MKLKVDSKRSVTSVNKAFTLRIVSDPWSQEAMKQIHNGVKSVAKKLSSDNPVGLVNAKTLSEILEKYGK